MIYSNNTMQRTLDDDSMPDEVDSVFRMASMENKPPDRETVPYSEINKSTADGCFGCKYFGEHNFKNPDFGHHMLQLFKIYTSNRINLPNKAIAWQMKSFFDNVLRPKMPEGMNEDWSLDCIEEHIGKHGFFATSEVMEQITALKNYRLMIQDVVWEKDTNGKMFLNIGYAKILLNINKQILLLMEKQKNLPDMVGYNKTLKF